MVLEAFLMATIFLGAASFVALSHTAPSTGGGEQLEVATQDALRAVVALRATDGQPLLDEVLRNAWLCAAQQGAAGCSEQVSPVLDSRLRAYLPPGAGYELTLTNGVAPLWLTPQMQREGASVADTSVYVPNWSHGVIAPRLSCHDGASTLHVQALFLRNGNAELTRSVSISHAGGEAAAVQQDGIWSATIAPASGVDAVSAHASSRFGAMAAAAPLGSCTLGPAGASLQVALADATLSVDPAKPLGVLAPGHEVVIRHDLSAAAALDNVTVTGAQVDVFGPGSGTTPLWRLALEPNAAGAMSWAIPASSLHGCYATLLRVQLRVEAQDGPVDVEARKLGKMCVTIPSGHTPPAPMYRLILRTWTHDWAG